jgi:hypothetical protein
VQSGNGYFLAYRYSIMMEKLAQAGDAPTPFHNIYYHI